MIKSSLSKPARLLILVIFLGLIFLPGSARADIAPPDQPPGANPVPEGEGTNVRMLAETVLLDVLARPTGGHPGTARVQADFVMENQSDQAETLLVRFPLTFWDGASDGFYRYPEITDLQVRVNGTTRSTRRVTTPNFYDDDGPPVPWAAFEVSFPPGEQVDVGLTYTTQGVGEYPFVSFNYILETGAGWADTIGSADLIVRLPYDANQENVLLEDHTGWSSTTPGAQFAGREIRWSFEDLEPTIEDNLEVSLVMPEAWQKILVEQQNVANNPEDGEAWGRLGKAAKEITLFRRGVRLSEGGRALYQLSNDAYANAIRLLPDDSLWHYGYADLLWVHYYYRENYEDPPDYALLQRILLLLQRSLELDPDNQRAWDLLEWISYDEPEAVRFSEDGIDLLLLTATPAFLPTGTPTALPTLTPSPTALPQSSATPTPVEITVFPTIPLRDTPTPIATNTPVEAANVLPPEAGSGEGGGVCGSALLLPALLAGALVFTRSRRTPPVQ